MPHGMGCDRISQLGKFLNVRISDENGVNVGSKQMANGGTHAPKPKPKDTKEASKPGSKSDSKGTKK